MKILHVCNWCSGITTRNVAALKQFSRHSHELVTRILHPYDMAVEPTHLVERDTTKEMVIGLAEEADVLHFHAVGYDGSEELRETIHGIDWSRFLGKKLFVLHAMCSYLHDDGESFTFHHQKAVGRARFNIANLDKYDALMGPHLSCKRSYEDRLEYVPDVIPINDWLYTPVAGIKPAVAATFKELQVAVDCNAVGVNLIHLPTPTKLPMQLDWRRRNCRATFDSSTDGHWGLFGIESLAQGVPCVNYTHPVNMACWDILGVPPPPFFDCGYGGAEVPTILKHIFSLPFGSWESCSRRCRRWVEEYYAPKNLVRRWDAVYDSIFTGKARETWTLSQHT